jgi:hypothetical protein
MTQPLGVKDRTVSAFALHSNTLIRDATSSTKTLSESALRNAG